MIRREFPGKTLVRHRRNRNRRRRGAVHSARRRHRAGLHGRDEVRLRHGEDDVRRTARVHGEAQIRNHSPTSKARASIISPRTPSSVRMQKERKDKDKAAAAEAQEDGQRRRRMERRRLRQTNRSAVALTPARSNMIPGSALVSSAGEVVSTSRTLTVCAHRQRFGKSEEACFGEAAKPALERVRYPELAYHITRTTTASSAPSDTTRRPHPCPVFIGGEWRKSPASKTPVYNPSRGESSPRCRCARRNMSTMP